MKSITFLLIIFLSLISSNVYAEQIIKFLIPNAKSAVTFAIPDNIAVAPNNRENGKSSYLFYQADTEEIIFSIDCWPKEEVKDENISGWKPKEDQWVVTKNGQRAIYQLALPKYTIFLCAFAIGGVPLENNVMYKTAIISEILEANKPIIVPR